MRYFVISFTLIVCRVLDGRRSSPRWRISPGIKEQDCLLQCGRGSDWSVEGRWWTQSRSRSCLSAPRKADWGPVALATLPTKPHLANYKKQCLSRQQQPPKPETSWHVRRSLLLRVAARHRRLSQTLNLKINW